MAIRYIAMRGIELLNKVFLNGEKYFRRVKLEPNLNLTSCDGYEEFKRKLANSPSEPLDISYSNFEGLSAPDLFLRGARCFRTNLRGANLECVNFSYADLRQTNLDGAVLFGGIFRNSKVHMTDFSKADLRSSEFNEARGIETIFRGARLNSSSFMGAKFRGADFSNHEDGTVTDLDRAYMGGVIFSYVRFNGARLTNANLVGTDFDNVDITGACLEGTAIGKNKGLEDCVGLNLKTLRLRS